MSYREAFAIERYENSKKQTQVLLDIEDNDKENPQFLSWPDHDDLIPISQEKLQEIIYHAAECFVPFH